MSSSTFLYAFLVDTNLSMNTNFDRNYTALEGAKAFIDNFLHKKEFIKSNSTFLLVTDSVLCYTQSEREISDAAKLIKCHGVGSFQGLKVLFEFLSCISRAECQGSYPNNETVIVIFWLTNAAKFTTNDAVGVHLSIPGLGAPGSNLFKEPFRWNQRMFTLVFAPESREISTDFKNLAVTMYGDLYRIPTISHAIQFSNDCLGLADPRSRKSPQCPNICNMPGVVVKFKYDNETWEEPIFVYTRQKGSTITNNFPIPEPYWPTSCLQKGQLLLPIKHCQPVIRVSTKPETFHLPEGFPADRFSLVETEKLKKLSSLGSGTCWTLYIDGSQEPGQPVLPFGYLKKRVGGVSMYILPYNFPKLLKLLRYALSNPAVGNSWKNDFERYMKQVPAYYYQPIQKSMTMMKLGILFQFPIPAIAQRFTDHSSKIRIRQNQFIDQFKELKPAKPIRNNLHNTQQERDEMYSLPARDFGDFVQRKFKVIENIQKDPYLTEEEHVKFLESVKNFSNPYREEKHKSSKSLTRDEDEEASQLGQVSQTCKQKRRSFKNKNLTMKLPRLSERKLLIPPIFSWQDLHSVYDNQEKLARPEPIEQIQVPVDEPPNLMDIDTTEEIESVESLDEFLDWPTRRQEIHDTLFQWPRSFEKESLQKLLIGLTIEQRQVVEKWASSLGRDLDQ